MENNTPLSVRYRPRLVLLAGVALALVSCRLFSPEATTSLGSRSPNTSSRSITPSPGAPAGINQGVNRLPTQGILAIGAAPRPSTGRSQLAQIGIAPPGAIGALQITPTPTTTGLTPSPGAVTLTPGATTTLPTGTPQLDPYAVTSTTGAPYPSAPQETQSPYPGAATGTPAATATATAATTLPSGQLTNTPTPGPSPALAATPGITATPTAPGATPATPAAPAPTPTLTPTPTPTGTFLPAATQAADNRDKTCGPTGQALCDEPPREYCVKIIPIEEALDRLGTPEGPRPIGKRDSACGR